MVCKSRGPRRCRNSRTWESGVESKNRRNLGTVPDIRKGKVSSKYDVVKEGSGGCSLDAMGTSQRRIEKGKKREHESVSFNLYLSSLKKTVSPGSQAANDISSPCRVRLRQILREGERSGPGI